MQKKQILRLGKLAERCASKRQKAKVKSKKAKPTQASNFAFRFNNQTIRFRREVFTNCWVCKSFVSHNLDCQKCEPLFCCCRIS